MEYSIVIPAYNESDKISSTLTQIVNFMRTFSESFEVIVVDDGSKDATVDVVRDYKKENSEIILIKNPHKGKGYALYTGFMKSRGDYIYMADADLSSPITELKKLSVWMQDHDNDVVIASREGVGANRINEPFYRHLMGRVFNLIVQKIALPGINDSQCGFKLFKRDVIKKVFPMLLVYGPDAKELKDAYTGAWDVEVLFLAHKAGFNIKEVPVQWIHVRTNRVNPFKDSFRMLMDVIKVRINDMQGKYQGLHHKAGTLY
jgi:dolichyl-phosphate beta-glucosyltransferase